MSHSNTIFAYVQAVRHAETIHNIFYYCKNKNPITYVGF